MSKKTLPKLNFFRVVSPGDHSLGGCVVNIAFCRHALLTQKKVMVICKDQVQMLKCLREYFPTNLMELVGNNLIRIHDR